MLSVAKDSSKTFGELRMHIVSLVLTCIHACMLLCVHTHANMHASNAYDTQISYILVLVSPGVCTSYAKRRLWQQDCGAACDGQI